MVPKLVAEDIPLLFSLLSDVFPNVGYTRAEMAGMCVYCTPVLCVLLNLDKRMQYLSACTNSLVGTAVAQ